MRESTIAKLDAWGPRTDFARALGAELRRHRHERGLRQADVGAPLTPAFVSAVELGYTVPSLAALALMLSRIGMSLGDFFDGVNSQLGAL